MHKFFETLNPSMVSRFEALMTNERAEHFLMDRTLSDATLITQENFEEICRDIEEAAAERVTKRKDEEIANLKKGYAEQMSDISARVSHLSERVERMSDETSKLTEELANTEKRWAMACFSAGRRAGIMAWGVVVVALAALAAAVSLLSGDGVGLRLLVATLTFVGTLIASLVSSRFWPENPLESWIAGRRQRAALAYARRHNVEGILTKYELDWDRKSVVRQDQETERNGAVAVLKNTSPRDSSGQRRR